jgi:hypothetical protein
MWESLSLRQQNEWRVFFELDPPEEDRTEYGLARIVQVLVRSDKPLVDMLLPFGDRPRRTVAQTLQDAERKLDAWIIGSNAQFRQGVKRE